MPIVNKVEFSLRDEEAMKRGYHRKKGYYKVTKYDSKDEVFIIELPDYMGEVLDRGVVSGSNQKAVDKLFRAAIREYNIRVATKKKVIAYQLNADVDTEIDGKQFTRKDIHKPYREDKTPNYNTGITLWYVVCWETHNPDSPYPYERGYKYYDLDGTKLSKPNYSAPIEAIDYTPEREAFFKEFEYRLALLVYNATEFLSKKEQLLIFIDASSRALPFIQGEEA